MSKTFRPWDVDQVWLLPPSIQDLVRFDVGAVDYVHKPFSAPIMLVRVKTHLALQAALQQARESQKQADELLYCLLLPPLPRSYADRSGWWPSKS
jgi:hypothetical protein